MAGVRIGFLTQLHCMACKEYIDLGKCTVRYMYKKGGIAGWASRSGFPALGRYPD
jgi:hypothetical protein